MTLLTVKDVAERLRVCPHTIRRYVKAGVLPVIRVNGHTMRFSEEAIKKVLQKRK